MLYKKFLLLLLSPSPPTRVSSLCTCVWMDVNGHVQLTMETDFICNCCVTSSSVPLGQTKFVVLKDFSMIYIFIRFIFSFLEFTGKDRNIFFLRIWLKIVNFLRWSLFSDFTICNKFKNPKISFKLWSITLCTNSRFWLIFFVTS